MEGRVTGSLYTGKLGGNAARDVYAATGIDADGYAVKLTEQAVGDTMQKIVAGSEMTMSDLSHIGEMALSAEQAERGGMILRKDALGAQELKQSRGAQGRVSQPYASSKMARTAAATSSRWQLTAPTEAAIFYRLTP